MSTGFRLQFLLARRKLFSSKEYNCTIFQQLLHRVTYDLSHIKVYSLLFGEIPSFMTGPQFNVCLQEGVRQTERLTTGMEMAVRVDSLKRTHH